MDDRGGGDQGIMYGYATNETKEYLPLPYVLSRNIAIRMDEINRHYPSIFGLDGKCQVSIVYDGDKARHISTVIVSAQTKPGINREEYEPYILEVLEEVLPSDLTDTSTLILINPTGEFITGGPYAEIVKTLTNGKLVDMIFTDPPYNVDYEGSTGMKIQNDKQKDSDFLTFLSKAFTNMAGQLKAGGVVYCCHADTEGLNFRTAFKGSGLKLSECLVWVKNSLVLGRQDYHWRHEPILYGWKEGESHYFAEDRTQDTVWEYNKPKTNDLHPTMKPIPLVARAINNSSRKGETVLDLFGGIACEELKRKALVMELDERYVDVIVKRYSRLKNSIDGCFLIRDGVKIPLSTIPDYAVEQSERLLD